MRPEDRRKTVENWIKEHPAGTFKQFEEQAPGVAYAGYFSGMKTRLKKAGLIPAAPATGLRLDPEALEPAGSKRRIRFRKFSEEVTDLRDYYAGLAMQILLMEDKEDPDRIARYSYKLADAMTRARG